MKDCELTTLSGTVQNNNLLKYGEIRVKMLAETTYNLFGTKKAQVLSVAPGSSGSIISGGSWSANSQNRIKATANTVISIPDKYSLAIIDINTDCKLVNKDIASLEYLTEMMKLSIIDDMISGDISSVSKMSNLTNLTLKPSADIIGDINGIGTKESLVAIDLSHTKVGGDISTLASKLPAIQDLRVGDNCYGDASLLNCHFFRTEENAQITWTGNRTAAGKYIMGIENNPNFGSYLDTMLIDQAGCTLKSGASSFMYKIIVRGTHTEGSGWQTAVSTLISKGITNVIINGTNYNSGNLPT